MKYLTFFLFISFLSCNGQKKVYKKKIGVCRLPINYDSIRYCGLGGGKNGNIVVDMNGKECLDTSGVAEAKRKVLLKRDTSVVQEYNDTTWVVLLTSVDGVKLRTKAFKVVHHSEVYTFDLYEDTLTKAHSLGNVGTGQVRDGNYVYPFEYLDSNKKPFSKEIKIYGEIETSIN